MSESEFPAVGAVYDPAVLPIECDKRAVIDRAYSQRHCPVCFNPAISPSAFVSSDRLFETTTRTFHLSACIACGCLFIDPVPSSQELASFYPEQYWWRRSPGFLKNLERAYRRFVLRDHIRFIAKSAPVRLLDVGCGSGTLIGLLNERGFQVQGFDSSNQAARVARADSDVDVAVAPCLEDAGFADAAFDVVTLFHVLEHVPHPRRLLAEVHRILQPNGRVILQVPNIESWQARLFGTRWYGLDVPRHVVNYSISSVQRLLSDSGFEVCRMRHFNLRDNAPALASTLFPSLDPVSRRARQLRRNRREGVLVSWMKHVAYLSAVITATPFAIVESLAGAGGTVMLEARKV